MNTARFITLLVERGAADYLAAILLSLDAEKREAQDQATALELRLQGRPTAEEWDALTDERDAALARLKERPVTQDWEVLGADRADWEALTEERDAARAGLEKNLTAINQKFNAERIALQGRIASLERACDQWEKNRKEWAEDKAVLEGSVSALQSKIGGAMANVTRLEGEKSALADQIATLERSWGGPADNVMSLLAKIQRLSDWKTTASTALQYLLERHWPEGAWREWGWENRFAFLAETVNGLMKDLSRKPLGAGTDLPTCDHEKGAALERLTGLCVDCAMTWERKEGG